MTAVGKKQLAVGLLALVIGIIPGPPLGVATAVEAGASAPDFNLPATTGVNISLSEFRGKKWVLLEFYGADFAPA